LEIATNGKCYACSKKLYINLYGRHMNIIFLGMFYLSLKRDRNLGERKWQRHTKP